MMDFLDMKRPLLALPLALLELHGMARTVCPIFCQSFVADLKTSSGALEQVCLSHN